MRLVITDYSLMGGRWPPSVGIIIRDKRESSSVQNITLSRFIFTVFFSFVYVMLCPAENGRSPTGGFFLKIKSYYILNCYFDLLLY